MTISLPKTPCVLPPKACVRDPSRTRLLTSVKWPCCAASPHAQLRAKTTSRQRLPRAVSASSRPHRAANSREESRIDSNLSLCEEIHRAGVTFVFLGRIAPLAVRIRTPPQALAAATVGRRTVQFGTPPSSEP